eukprot:TRINITY_DN3090_c0_g1_i1.p2 TRINITY_DN3090_c0_g1~~TRINITY_DN3090_c0_g1_i1.p2  ORF type:complete len:275 (-),score=59.82 TRINITY_DN3090_c0_g1_i1:165-989(-)
MYTKRTRASAPLASKPRLIIIEGNICAGKSTLSRELAAATQMELFLEPTATNPFLEKYYQNPKAYALKMQLWLLRQRYVAFVTAIKHIFKTGKGVILDRSVFSDWVFAEQNRRDGNIDEAGFQYYMHLRNRMLARLPLPHIAVYLDVPAKVCCERIHALRKRDCESGIPIEYLEGLHSCYNEFASDLKASGANVLNLQWSEFGNAGHVAAQVEASGFAEWENGESIRAFINDKQEVEQAMLGGDLAVEFDDEHVNTNEFSAAMETDALKDCPLR